MARKRTVNGKKCTKWALCPLCNDYHWIFGRYWLIPCAVRRTGEGAHIGVQTEIWCHIEQQHVVKQYSPAFKYIGCYIADEIPF